MCESVCLKDTCMESVTVCVEGGKQFSRSSLSLLSRILSKVCVFVCVCVLELTGTPVAVAYHLSAPWRSSAGGFYTVLPLDTSVFASASQNPYFFLLNPP